MKKLGILLLAVVIVLGFLSGPAAAAGEEDITTVIMVRHGEQNAATEEMELTDAGLKRAQELARVLKDVDIAAIYATLKMRTQQTAEPTAQEKKISVSTYNYNAYWDLVKLTGDLLTRHRGKAILICGHSDDVPIMAKIFVGQYSPNQKVDVIPKEVYDNLFLVSVPASGKTRVLQLKYGAASPTK
jgi:2,3-bisphosphoglycerate-dependent phosphoglycerate mutase